MKRSDLVKYIECILYNQGIELEDGDSDVLVSKLELVLAKNQPFRVVNLDCECVCKCDEHQVTLEFEREAE